jgi:hypothetical protein
MLAPGTIPKLVSLSAIAAHGLLLAEPIRTAFEVFKCVSRTSFAFELKQVSNPINIEIATH